MRLSDLRDCKVRSLDGARIGRVHEVHCDNGRLVAVTCGPAGLIERLTSKSRGQRIAWERVVKLERGELVVSSEAANRKANGARSRRGTRRPSAPRSAR